jgi:ABC-type antimicrobial peptide transport system permease subunit
MAYVPRPRVESRDSLLVWAPGLSATEVHARVAGPISALAPGVVVSASAVSFESLFLRDIGEANFQRPIVLTFGLFAFGVAAVGLFGLVSYLVAQRIRDFGIQIALGARPAHLWRSVVRESLIPACLGLSLGLGVAAALERMVRARIFGWDASGPLAMSIVAVALLSVAILAAVGPARRAMRVDPVMVLRGE